MTDKQTYRPARDPSEHLSEVEFAIYAEFLRRERDDLPEELRLHVEGCPYCRHEIMAITDMMDEVDKVEDSGDASYGKYAYPPVLKRLKPVFRIAAALALLFLASWIIQQVLRKPDNDPMVKVENTDTLDKHPVTNPDTGNGLARDSTATAPGDKIPEDRKALDKDNNPVHVAVPDTIRYAGAFIPNPSYEALVGGKFRAANNPQVKSQEPDEIMAPGDSLSLTWIPDPRDTYNLVIVDNKGSEVRSVGVGTGSSLKWRIDLTPGLYYWKFTGIEDLWKVGRLVVRSEN